MPLPQALIPVLLLLYGLVHAGQAVACRETGENALLGEKILKKDSELAASYTKAMMELEGRCQKTEAELSSKAASQASAASCVALSEFSAMNEKLSKESEWCEQKSLELESKWTGIRESSVEPNQNFMLITGLAFRTDTALRSFCPSEVAAFEKIAVKTRELAKSVRASEAKSRDNKVKFGLLAKQTRDFYQKTLAAAKGCASESTQRAVSSTQGQGGRKDPVPAAVSKNRNAENSSLTGVDEAIEIENESRKRIAP